MPPQVGATCAFQKHHGEGRRKGTQGHVRDRIGRGLEGRGKGLLSTHLQGAELPLLKSGKVLARKAPGAFLSTEYFCRSWGHQCARLLRCSARCRPLLSYRCCRALLRRKDGTGPAHRLRPVRGSWLGDRAFLATFSSCFPGTSKKDGLEFFRGHGPVVVVPLDFLAALLNEEPELRFLILRQRGGVYCQEFAKSGIMV